MITEKREKTLKSGIKITISTPEEADAERLLDYFSRIYGESDYLLRYPEEVVLTVEDEKTFIQRQRENERSIFLMAKDDSGNILGTAQASPIGSVIKVKHRAECAISVRKKYNGLGIGSELMKSLLMNIHNLGFTQLELEVVDGNIRAERLYQKLGFTRTGVTPRAFRLKDGRYLDLVKMVLPLSEYPIK